MPEGAAIVDRRRPSDTTGYISMLVDFGGELRAEGLPVGSGELATYGAAMAALDPGDLVDLYWAGRAALVGRRDHIDVFDRVFRRFFLAEEDRIPEPLRTAIKRSNIENQTVVEIPATEPGVPGKDESEARLGLIASDIDLWRHKSFAACTPEELAVLRRIMTRVRLIPPRRRSRRTEPSGSGGRPDLRRTVRMTMRTHGEPSALYWRRRRQRMRPLVLILDVSGSMADYSRALLQFAYSARRAAGRVEVFCFGTRLTRITRSLERRRPDDALDAAAAIVFDWEGGTRIGQSLDEFVRLWGRRGLSRGAVVVICSDGLDRGDPAVLARAMERLSRLSHKVVWVNPHVGETTDFRPSTLGMMVAAPYVDLLLPGHDLASLEELAASLPDLR